MFITDRNHLAVKLNVPIKNLTYLLYIKKIENCYTSFEIPKKDGTSRIINTPNAELKDIQRRLAGMLYKKQREIFSQLDINPNISHGFEKKKSIITNAKIHRNKRFVFNLDLKDFFNSFHFGRVRGYFNNNKHFGLDINIATTIAQLTCYNGSLPQGAPTSPVISNLICQILDFRLLKIAKKYKLDYTRYADDLTFSTNDKHFPESYDSFMKEISKVIEKSGFQINDKKTNLKYRDSKQTVTGLIVNKKVNVDANYFRTTKAMAHSLYTKGEFFINGEPGTVNQLDGRFSFINQIDKYDNINCTEKIKKMYSLNAREKQYQRFLFYKLFLRSNKPLIATEGKTDVIYIKAALKNLYKSYPELVKLDANGKFEFLIHFLKRNKKMNYFFGITGDGADSLNNIYHYYFGGRISGHQCNNYNRIFNAYKTVFTSPTIIIYDNELSNKNKPISKFEGYKKMSEDKKSVFPQVLKMKLDEESNLYLLTNQLVKGKSECEIEDLFSDDILNVEIDGRKFDRKVKKGDNSHFGKNDFAEYVMQHYETIDFSNFKPLLDNINEIVITYKAIL